VTVHNRCVTNIAFVKFGCMRVRYDAVNAMLLNEFLKAHRKMQEQEKRIDALTAQLKEQKALIREVSDKIELNKPAPQVVNNNQ
jgi:hypothetical protein